MLAVLTVVGTVAALGSLALASPAQAAPKMTVQGNNNLKGGEKLNVTVSGFSPNMPIAIGMCPTGRALKGAGDCGPSKDNMSVLTASDASGSATATLVVPDRGKALGNTSGAPAKCPPCSVAAANIQKNSETASVKLKYAAGGGGSSAQEDDASDGASGGASDATTDSGGAASDATTDSSATLSSTGPRETALVGVSALLMLLLGTGVARAARYRGAHRLR